jgi:hypothetical protein
MRLLATLTMCLILGAPVMAQNTPANTAPPAINEAELPPSPAQERKAAISQGMLLGTMAVVLVVLALVGGIAVYVTRRHQAAPDMKDL